MADRSSATGGPAGKKNYFTELIREGNNDEQKRFSFDQNHFDKFMRENKNPQIGTFMGGLDQDSSPKRRR